MNLAETQLAALAQRQRRLEQVFVRVLMAPENEVQDLKDEVRRGYMEAGRHAMADPPEDESEAFEMGYLAKKMERTE